MLFGCSGFRPYISIMDTAIALRKSFRYVVETELHVKSRGVQSNPMQELMALGTTRSRIELPHPEDCDRLEGL